MTRQVDREISQATGEVAAFANADVRLLEDRFKLMAGFRFSGIGNVLPQNVEPRIRLSYSLLKNLYINGSLDRHYQYVHQVTPDVTIYPNELYLLPGDRFPAEKSDQAAVGVGGLLNTLQWSVEAFQKRQSGLVQINPGQERSENFIERFPNNVLSGGEGKMKGLEIYLKRDAEKLSYSLAYTLSKSERRYDEINGGQWFPFTYDRRHDLSTTLSKAIGEKWRMNASFTFQSGYSFSAPIARTAFFDIYGKYNGARLTPFHLLNLSATKLWNGSKRPNRYHSITYALYNAYNRPNAYSLELTPTSRTIVDPITGVEQTVSSLKIVTLSLFPIVPSLNYTVTIK